MKKKTDKELGYLITDGMIDTIGNMDLSDAQVGMFIRSIVGGNRDYAKNDMLVKALVTAFIDQFKAVNKRRTDMIGRRRESNRDRERLRREESNLAREKLGKIDDLCAHMSTHVGTCGHMSAHVRTCAVSKVSNNNNIYPYNPPAGDEKDSSAKLEDHAQTGSPSKGRRTRPSARPTARNTSISGDSRERPATSSKKTTGANLWDGAAVVVKAAEAMMARHPNAKSGKRAVERAIVAAIEDDNDGDRVAPETVDAIRTAHEAWCATDEWKPDKGQFVQSLAAWIRNGGWTKPPPEKKQARPKAAREEGMSFGASL